MGLKVSNLWRAPAVNPINGKARSVPILNPTDPYGRVFFFSWIGFMLAYWAWYTFPPLLTVTIKKDLGLTTQEVANSHIISLCATILVQFCTGPLCDQFGPRRVFAGILLTSSLPIGFAPLVKNTTGLYISRFFIGILGATFTPCQVWCTGFFDKNIVGTANALAGGWGNAGGGITYFIMPAVFDSLVASGHSEHIAWRITFVVPAVCLIACGLCMLTLCDDTPMGPWKERHQHVQENLASHGVTGTLVDVPGSITEAVGSDEEKGPQIFDSKVAITRTEALETAQGETVISPGWKEAMGVVFSLQTLFHAFAYACSLGGALAVNSILSSYYLKNFPYLGQTKATTWASMFGLLNFVTRPMGGMISDLLYKLGNKNLWLKKGWITVCGVMTGVMLLIIGKLDPHTENTMLGLVFILAVFHEAGNGANFGLIPHVHPFANGILSGVTGGSGNLGGVIITIIFRFMDGGKDYAKGFWVIGIMHIAMNLAVAWIPPLPRGQIGGR